MHSLFLRNAQKTIAAGLCCLLPAVLPAQQPAEPQSQQAPQPVKFEQQDKTGAGETSIEPVRPSAPILWRPYVAPEVPPIRLSNSHRIRDLVRAGKLYLTAQDAVALALENNIDIEVSRYSPIYQAWQLERSQAGGALPGVPSGASQTSSVQGGQGVLGSQAAAGVSISGSNGANRASSNATISQIGPITQTLDPIIQEASVFSHKSLPQPDAVQSVANVLVQGQRVYTGSYQQGFVFGGSINISYNNHYLNENAPTDVLNPSIAPTLSASLNQSLLQGFGTRVGGRTIEVSKINLATSELNFKTQLIGTVVNVLDAYHALVADFEDVKAKQSALQTSAQFLEDSRKQLEVGALAPLDVTTAESQVAAAQQNLINSQTGLTKDELSVKNLISRTGSADPVLNAAQIIPLDNIDIPASDNLPPVKSLIEQALANRADLAAEKANIKTAEVSAIGTANGVLPILQGLVTTSNAGLAGTPRTVNFGNGFIDTANPYFIGGVGTALGQIFRRNFPSQSGGAYFQATIQNRAAVADNNVDQLSLRQTQLTTAKDFKQAQVDILNAVVALTQSRARYDAAVKARILDEQLLDAEQKKFKLGSSISYNVISQARDLDAARSTEIADRVSYANARTALDQATGTTLENNNVVISEARTGHVTRPSGLPEKLPDAPPPSASGDNQKH